MHELGLLTGVVKAVSKAAADAHAVGVATVALRVGVQSGAVEEALQGSWPLATQGTIVDGASLDVETVEAAVWCPACAAEQPIDEFFALACPLCGTPTANLVRGREFEVRYVDLITASACKSQSQTPDIGEKLPNSPL